MLDQIPILQLIGFPFGRGEAIEIPVPKLNMVDQIVQQNRHVATPRGIPWLNQYVRGFSWSCLPVVSLPTMTVPWPLGWNRRTGKRIDPVWRDPGVLDGGDANPCNLLGDQRPEVHPRKPICHLGPSRADARTLGRTQRRVGQWNNRVARVAVLRLCGSTKDRSPRNL